MLGLTALSVHSQVAHSNQNQTELSKTSVSTVLLAQNDLPTELNCSNPIEYKDIDGDGIPEKCCPFEKGSEGPPYLCLLSGGGGTVGPIW